MRQPSFVPRPFLQAGGHWFESSTPHQVGSLFQTGSLFSFCRFGHGMGM